MWLKLGLTLYSKSANKSLEWRIHDPQSPSTTMWRAKLICKLCCVRSFVFVQSEWMACDVRAHCLHGCEKRIVSTLLAILRKNEHITSAQQVKKNRKIWKTFTRHVLENALESEARRRHTEIRNSLETMEGRKIYVSCGHFFSFTREVVCLGGLRAAPTCI